MKYKIELNESEVKLLKRARDYFGEHDATKLEHSAYSLLDKLVRQLKPKETVSAKQVERVCNTCYHNFMGHRACLTCDESYSNWRKKTQSK